MADDDRDDDGQQVDDQNDQTDGQPDDDGQDGADKLADAGKQALDRMKAERNKARTELREYKALGLTAEQIRELQQGKKPADDAPDPEKIRDEARREARAEAMRERVVDKIEAKAARGFADAEDAVAILLRTHQADDFLDDGKIDVEAIQDALDELLEKKPHLAAAQGDQRRFRGSADQGPRKEKPPTLAEQITAAEKAGDFRTAMNLKAKQLADASTY